MSEIERAARVLGGEVEWLRALIDRILRLSDFTAAQQDAIRREAGLLRDAPVTPRTFQDAPD